ncbi:polyisoprenoid diphosphate/phosphate phosphohydrolase PLPP6-like [Sycon ciliatum]|uniref:polyisoprenoid diphosphate/phosphate phosphohydrolase PLPP6-like n=1 Tax=Sycon ciliatum TaxID=27933 RepID=UPI0031F6385A
MTTKAERWSGKGQGAWHDLVAADCRISRWIALEFVPATLTSVKRWMGLALEYSGHGVPWIVLGIYALKTARSDVDKALAVNFLLGLILDLLVICLVKAVAARPRPPYDVKHRLLSIAVDRNNAFPSGHATRAVLIVAFCAGYVTTNTLVWLAVWAVCLCASRVLIGRHHLLDVVVAVPLGYLEAMISRHWLITVGITDFFLPMWT